MTETIQEPLTAEKFNARYKALLTVISGIGAEAHARVAAHIRAVTTGRDDTKPHISLGTYHVSSLSMEEKNAEYVRIWNVFVTNKGPGKAEVKPDWSKLKGQIGAGAKPAAPEPQRADPLEKIPAIDLEKKEPVELPQPAKHKESPTVKQTVTPAVEPVNDDLASLIAQAIRNKPSAGLTEQEVRLIAAEEVARIDWHTNVSKCNHNGSFPLSKVEEAIATAFLRFDSELSERIQKAVDSVVSKCVEDAVSRLEVAVTVSHKPKEEASPKKRHAAHDTELLRQFIGPTQMHCMADGCRGEEKDYFYDKLSEFTERISTMPKTKEQDGLGDKAIAYLHYFAGGQANWYITEKDMETPDEPGQHQAFGLADLFGDGGELGYISIVEILANGGELDLHWKPKTLEEIRNE